MRLAASFRDPAGFLFSQNGILYRQVNTSFQDDFRFLHDSGLYRDLLDRNLIIAAPLSDEQPEAADSAFAVLRPERIPFVSYPYEWSFSGLKNAALLTLELQRHALDHGMVLKDATAYNIQFIGTGPIHIDTLSFARYCDGEPWVAYRQFCQHFLAPLTLMASVDPRTGLLLRTFIDGIPLDLACRLLRGRVKFNPYLFIHLFLHECFTRKDIHSERRAPRVHRLEKKKHLDLLQSLAYAISGLSLPGRRTNWTDYYDRNRYSAGAFRAKCAIVNGCIDTIRPSNLLDVGANSGVFSKEAAAKGIYSVAVDFDAQVINGLYDSLSGPNASALLLPLVIDSTNPSPALGFGHEERESFSSRCDFDAVLALALMHHLLLTHNVPFFRMAGWFKSLGKNLIIEFVPSNDSQFQGMVATKTGVHQDYTRAGFEKAFGEHFLIEESAAIPESTRIIYRMRRK